MAFIVAAAVAYSIAAQAVEIHHRQAIFPSIHTYGWVEMIAGKYGLIYNKQVYLRSRVCVFDHLRLLER